MSNMQKLVDSCIPIAEILRDEFHPHVSVIITADGMRVEESIYGHPFVEQSNDSDL